MYTSKLLVAFFTTCLLAACEGTLGSSWDVEMGPDGMPVTGSGPGGTAGGAAGGTVGGLAGSTGQQLYDQNCAACHGAAGEGGGVWPGSIVAYEPIEPIVANGRGDMPAMALATEDVALIQQYLLDLAPQPPADGTTVEPMGGQQLYERYCGTCHGADATGGVKWSGSIAGYTPIDEIVTQGRGTMEPVPVAAEELVAIQEYLLTLGPDITTLSGVEVYELRCATCHGDEGQGTTEGFQLRYQADAYSKWVIRNGRASSDFASDMPAFPELSDEQVDEMLAWLSSFPKPETGEGLYAQYCANCHGAGGSDGPVGEGVRGDTEVWEKVRRGENTSNLGSRSTYMPGWSADVITDADIDAMEAYLGSI